MKISNLLTGASLALIVFTAIQAARAQNTATMSDASAPASLGANQPVNTAGSMAASVQTAPTASLGANTSNISPAGNVNGGYNGNSGYNANNPNWNSENAYWKQNFASRPYYQTGANYSTFQPAYQYGVNAYSQYGGLPYSAVQTQLQNNWNSARGNSNLTWTQAQKATQDAYERIYNIQHNLNPGVTAVGTGAGATSSTNSVNSTTSNANANIGTRGNVGTGTTASGTNFGVSTATVNGVPAAAPPAAPTAPNAPIAPAATTPPVATAAPAATAGVAATSGHK